MLGAPCKRLLNMWPTHRPAGLERHVRESEIVVGWTSSADIAAIKLITHIMLQFARDEGVWEQVDLEAPLGNFAKYCARTMPSSHTRDVRRHREQKVGAHKLGTSLTAPARALEPFTLPPVRSAAVAPASRLCERLHVLRGGGV